MGARGREKKVFKEISRSWVQVFCPLLLFLDRLLPSLGTCLTLPHVRSLPYLFSASASQGAKQGRSPGCSWARLPLARERAVGSGGASGLSCPCWGRTACGKVPADLQPFLGQWTLQAALMPHVSLCLLLPLALPALLPAPGATTVLPMELPQCPAAAGSGSVEFSLFFFFFFLSLSNHCRNTTFTKTPICNLAAELDILHWLFWL